MGVSPESVFVPQVPQPSAYMLHLAWKPDTQVPRCRTCGRLPVTSLPRMRAMLVATRMGAARRPDLGELVTLIRGGMRMW
jgi:hypothetical protein